jgi:hypothetical protein
MAFYRHHPLNPKWGLRRTHLFGNVEFKYAVWLFTPFFDVVMRVVR